MRGIRKDDQYKKWGIIGDNGKGKTTFLLELIKSSYDLNTNRVLILCETNPKAYKDIYRIKTYEELKDFESGIALFWDYDNPEMMMLKNLINILNEGAKNMEEHPQSYGTHYLHNGAIVFDDCSNYIPEKPPIEVMKFLGNYRMYLIDLIFVSHTLCDFPAKLRRRMNFYTLFKTLENISEQKLSSLSYPRTEIINEAWIRVMNNPNNFANLTIKTGSS